MRGLSPIYCGVLLATQIPSIKGLSPLNKNNRTMRGQTLRRVAGFASDLVVATARQTRSQNRKNFFDQIPPFFHFCAQSESLLARRRARLDSNASVHACCIAHKACPKRSGHAQAWMFGVWLRMDTAECFLPCLFVSSSVCQEGYCHGT